MVGGFVQQQHVGLGQRSRQGQHDVARHRTNWRPKHPTGQTQGIERARACGLTPAADRVDLVLQILAHQQVVHLVIGHLFTEFHRDFVEFGQQRFDFRYTLFNVAANVFGVVQLRLLLQVTDPQVVGRTSPSNS